MFCERLKKFWLYFGVFGLEIVILIFEVLIMVKVFLLI